MWVWSTAKGARQTFKCFIRDAGLVRVECHHGLCDVFQDVYCGDRSPCSQPPYRPAFYPPCKAKSVSISNKQRCRTDLAFSIDKYSVHNTPHAWENGTR